jgi:hypothetical protein
MVGVRLVLWSFIVGLALPAPVAAARSSEYASESRSTDSFFSHCKSDACFGKHPSGDYRRSNAGRVTGTRRPRKRDMY